MAVKTKHIVIGSVAVIGLSVLAWWLTDRSKKEKEKSNGERKQPAMQTTGMKEKVKPSGISSYNKAEVQKKKKRPAPVADEFPLRLGSRGKRVERLNIWLMRNFGHTGVVSDVFDEITGRQLMKALKKTELDKENYLRYGMEKPVHEQKVMQ
ncbi:MAG: hypothetical protein H6585_10170 [Flavobacteriales bacterium]|nr:hypothetical protein [Flavobacteriales bacterium]